MIIGKAYGTAYVAMNSKSIGADLVYAWDNAEIGMMDASLAAKIMYADADAAELMKKLLSTESFRMVLLPQQQEAMLTL